ncbi:adenylosuccinate lyase [Haloquadratum walsbyi]|jgi:Adenylosuccinate lyase (EC 4.3.2.2)|uniref:Adenylosuccinate lyase n=1 Tax=Haloquadratum walsbyi J07HQW2 TaxID=1238425 RepID=U1PW75_9EURY|nr:adenylosuccinate lyase [Haloquadratum walsbyi]ERG96686.1 MAG: adenylosuccinate lyase [Haloquadratum walsbyi J07HQW2]
MDDLSRDNPLAAVSPLDGRYSARTAPLVSHTSEAALMHARLRVEIEYLYALDALDGVSFSLNNSDRDTLETTLDSFDGDDAAMIKQLEVNGAAGYSATNHDVKAIEYFLRIQTPSYIHPWIHFGLTSEDINNLSHRLLIRSGVSDVLVPALQSLRDELTSLAQEYRDTPMLAQTHGQPATPTTFGKEMAVYATRVGTAIGRITNANSELTGKLAGASGTYAAHTAAYPDINWQAFAQSFVTDFGFEHIELTTQINPCDDLATLFDALCGVNDIIVDLDRDAWLYISDRYLGQEATTGETGSSTMPHKVNPIDFENAEGNLSKATSDLRFLADYITNSRLQRDLSDSTVKRNIGAGFAHALIGYKKTTDGLQKVVPNQTVMQSELESYPELIGEAIQTILRREGDVDAYERIKELTRGEDVTLEDFQELFESLSVSKSVREELQALSPLRYTGRANELVDEIDEQS